MWFIINWKKIYSGFWRYWKMQCSKIMAFNLEVCIRSGFKQLEDGTIECVYNSDLKVDSELQKVHIHL